MMMHISMCIRRNRTSVRRPNVGRGGLTSVGFPVGVMNMTKLTAVLLLAATSLPRACGSDEMRGAGREFRCALSRRRLSNVDPKTAPAEQGNGAIELVIQPVTPSATTTTPARPNEELERIVNEIEQEEKGQFDWSKYNEWEREQEGTGDEDPGTGDEDPGTGDEDPVRTSNFWWIVGGLEGAIAVVSIGCGVECLLNCPKYFTTGIVTLTMGGIACLGILVVAFLAKCQNNSQQPLTSVALWSGALITWGGAAVAITALLDSVYANDSTWHTMTVLFPVVISIAILYTFGLLVACSCSDSIRDRMLCK